MKISEVTTANIIEYIRENPSDPEVSAALEPMKAAAKEYLKSYTGLTAEELDEHEDLTIAYLILVGDMYDNRTTVVSSGAENKTLATILSLYSKHNVG